MKPTIQIQRNHRKPKGEDKRTLELRVTFKRKSLYYVAGGTIKLTEQEFANKHLKKCKEAMEELLPAYNAAVQIVNKLGDNFTFESFYSDYRRVVKGEVRSAYDVRSIFNEYLSDAARTRPMADRTVQAYTTALNWLVKFRPKLTINEITPDLIGKFELYIQKQCPNVSQNSINSYFRGIKAVYNYAVERGYCVDTKPFKKHPLTATRKVNYGLSAKTYRQIYSFSSSSEKAMFGRDMFVLCFELNGHYMSDILRLKNKNVFKTDDGYVLQFIRHKTKRHQIPVTMYMTDEAIRILGKYGKLDSGRGEEYILSFLSGGKNERQTNDKIHDINDRANAGLRIIARELGLPHITMAQARHTYATIQCEFGRSVLDIQADMGHSNSTTTQGYINSLRTSSMQRSKQIKEQLHNR